MAASKKEKGLQGPGKSRINEAASDGDQHHPTIKKSIRTALHDSEAQLRIALDAARMGIWTWNILTDTITWSTNTYKIFGRLYESFDGTFEGYKKIIHPEDLEEVLANISGAVSHANDYYIEHRILHEDRTIHWIEAIGKVLVDETGKAVQMTGTVRDITDKKTFEIDSINWRLKFDLIADATGIIIYDYDILTGQVKWSANMEEVLGYTSHYISDVDTWGNLIHDDDREGVYQCLEESKQMLDSFDSLYRFRKQDGTFHLMLDKGFYLVNKAGKAYRMLGIMQDVSRQIETERALKESEGRFKQLIQELTIGVILQGAGSEIILFNKFALALLGLTENQLYGKTSFDPDWHTVHEDGSPFPGEEHPVPRAIATLKPVHEVVMGVYRPATKDHVWLLTNANPILTPQGELIHVICTFTNITERKKMEEELKESEQRFRILQHASYGGIGLHNMGVLIDCNQGLCDITGYTREELIGMDGLQLVAPEHREATLEKIKAGYDKPYDLEGIRKDGSRYVLEIQGKEIPYKGLTIRVTEFRNITDRKRAEENILEQNAKLFALTEDLKRKNEQLEEFTQIVSHNLRAPVGNILTLTGFIEDADTDEEKDEFLKLLKESGVTTLTMLNDLNDVLKVKQNKNIERQELSFDKVFLTTRTMLNAKITETSAVITCDFSKATTVHYPGIYLESIFLNLLSNSLKYFHPQRTPVIEFKTYSKNGKIIMEVRDNGLGINLEKYGHQVFKMRKTFHRHPESRGIGLFMIKNQIEAMGGDITIFSIPNEGTTFFINFNKYES